MKGQTKWVTTGDKNSKKSADSIKQNKERQLLGRKKNYIS
jgi:hypothetical protein